MANKIECKILNDLIDSFEKSKTFIGENVNEQNFKITVSKLFPKYDDDSEFDFYKEINSSLESLKSRGFIYYKTERSGKIQIAFLAKESIPEIYRYLKRQSKADINELLLAIWNEFNNLDYSIYKPLLVYIDEQKRNLKENKSVVFFSGNLMDYKDILLAAKEILKNDSEIFIRELSVKLFNNSKHLESLESKVRSLLYKYGDYDDKETVLEEHNVIKTPAYVMVKGAGILNCGQTIDLSKIDGDLGLSTQTLKSLSSIYLNGANVITIENLTNFHKYIPNNELVIYLGGFHNSVKREFIKLVEKCNPYAKFSHFGDIDAGGFYILEHLKKKTCVDFKSFHMNIDTLEKYRDFWIKLTPNDRIRLCALKNDFSDYSDIIDYMLENDCKLEQEVEILD